MAKKISADLLKRARAVKLIAMDVDGVLTAGEIIVLGSGEEVKLWNAKDRLCLALVRDLKIPLRLAWITGRSSPAVSQAADNLGVMDVVQNCHDKKKALQGILAKYNLSEAEAAYVGDDLLDLAVLRWVAFSACPSDAVRDVRRIARYVSPVSGGRGVIQDVLEFILRAQNKWDALLRSLGS